MPDKPLTYCLHLREDLSALRDKIFETDELYGMRSDLYMYRDLRDFLKQKNIELHTQAVLTPQDADVIICVNETAYFENYKRSATNKRLVLLLSEPPLYNANDWQETRHRSFDKVFTYNPDLVAKNPDKYVPFIYPINFDIPKPLSLPSKTEFEKRKNSCLIAGAFTITKDSENPGSLLHERYKVMAWYHKHAPNQLDYYGRTHPQQKFMHFKGASLINKVNPAITQRVAARSYRKKMELIYKGPVPGLRKNQTLAAYKFNFCFENTAGLKGYITEKLFDCFFSSTVPVYYGAPDVEHYIPRNCFISYTDFRSMKSLQKHLAEMDYNTYIQYLANAAAFLNSPAAQTFSTANFIDTLYSQIRL